MEKEIVLLKTLFIRAYNLFLDGHYEDSLKLLSHTSEIWVDYFQKSKFLTLMGMNYFKLNELNKAERALLEALAVSPESVKVLDLLGQIYYYQKRYIESEKAFLTAKRRDFYNFYFSIKTAKSAWKSGSYLRMFKRLKEGYVPDLIDMKEERKLKDFLLNFLRDSKTPDAYVLTKRFRAWCYERKKKYKRQKIR